MGSLETKEWEGSEMGAIRKETRKHIRFYKGRFLQGHECLLVVQIHDVFNGIHVSVVDFSGTDGNEGILLEEGSKGRVARAQWECRERTPSRVPS